MMLTLIFERVVPFLNTVGAAVALCVNWRAVKLGPPAHRPLRAVVASLCALYVVAYTLLWTGIILGASERGYWSQGMASVGLIVWPVVWIWQARQDVQQFQSALISAGLKEKADDRIGGDNWVLGVGRSDRSRIRHHHRATDPSALRPSPIRRAS